MWTSPLFPGTHLTPVIFFVLVLSEPALYKNWRSPFSIGRPSLSTFIFVICSAIKTLLNLFVPSSAKASSALKQYSAEYSTRPLGSFALFSLSAS